MHQTTRIGQSIWAEGQAHLLIGGANELVGEAQTNVGVRAYADGWAKHRCRVPAAARTAHVHERVEGE